MNLEHTDTLVLVLWRCVMCNVVAQSLAQFLDLGEINQESYQHAVGDCDVRFYLTVEPIDEK